MKLGYFPGCSLESSAREYKESLQAIAPLLDLELCEVADWNCCGATAAHSVNRKLALALPARTLALAERAGFDELLVPCSACFSRLAATRRDLLADESLRQEITSIIELDYVGSTKVVSVVDVLSRALPTVRAKTIAPFAHKVACYYGCYLTRPASLTTCVRPEDPQEMEAIAAAAGATPVDWAFKVECCGAALSVSRTATVAELAGRIVADAAERGAEALVVACPLCHTNLDLRRPAIERHRGASYALPVLYITQLVGLALGLAGRTLGLHRHHVPVRLAACAAAPAAPAAAPKEN